LQRQRQLFREQCAMRRAAELAREAEAVQ
jgi:hypothetical protein